MRDRSKEQNMFLNSASNMINAKKSSELLKRERLTAEFQKDMNRNVLLGLAAGFAAITFASTADTLDFDNDGKFKRYFLKPSIEKMQKKF